MPRTSAKRCCCDEYRRRRATGPRRLPRYERNRIRRGLTIFRSRPITLRRHRNSKASDELRSSSPQIPQRRYRRQRPLEWQSAPTGPRKATRQRALRHDNHCKSEKSAALARVTPSLGPRKSRRKSSNKVFHVIPGRRLQITRYSSHASRRILNFGRSRIFPGPQPRDRGK
jgi:hypothetical protein